MDNGFDPIIGTLNAALNLRTINQNVVAANIANADTPGYHAKVMDFESSLREAIEAQHRAGKNGMGEEPVYPEIVDDPNGVESLDGNTVDRAGEMAKLAQNQHLYDASVEMLKRKLGMLKYAISEGGGGSR